MQAYGRAGVQTRGLADYPICLGFRVTNTENEVETAQTLGLYKEYNFDCTRATGHEGKRFNPILTFGWLGMKEWKTKWKLL